MRVAITTLGCKVNQYDTAVIERRLDERGWQRVEFAQAADAYVINSCTVTDRADSEARRMARRARRTNPRARVVMTGCYAQTKPAEVEALDCVDYVVGLGRLDDLLGAVAGELAATRAVSDLRHAPSVETLGISSFPGRTRAFVKVQEGCNLFCTFCIVPVARGRSRSVPPRQILEEIERLAARGYREVVLTGVHLGGYGADLDPPCDLAFLLETIAERGPAVRVRVSSVDPPELSVRLVEALAAGPSFCRHLHVPLQAASDGVLARMGRRYSRAQAAEALARVRERLPGVCIGTDLITGFPGETEEEFTEGMEFVERLGLGYLHVFPYSQRSSTSAAKRWEPLADHVVHERARTMRGLDTRLRRGFRRRFLGSHARVLIEASRDPASGLLKGYSDNYLPIVCHGDDHLMNRIVRVRITGERDGRLQGVTA